MRNRIGFFLHIPFPVPELLLTLPGPRQAGRPISAPMISLGFQTDNDVRALSRYITEEAGGRIDENGDGRGHRTATPRAGAFPIGIDTEDFAELAEKSVTRARDRSGCSDSLAGRALVIGVDRLDYSKGLPQRFEAFHELLARWPEHRAPGHLPADRAVSRGEIAQYRALRREIEGLAGRINGHYSEFDWTPVRYLNKPFPRKMLAGFYRASQVGLVTPVRDGMNLGGQGICRRPGSRTIPACSSSRASPARRAS